MTSKEADERGADTSAPEISGAERTASERKWGKGVIAVGFTVVPSLLFRAQARLGLNAVQLVILLHMVDHWWFRDSLPYPSKKTLGERCGLGERQVQRYLSELEAAGYIKRKARFAENQGQLSNYYDLSGLVSALKRLEPEFRAVEEQHKLVKERRKLLSKKGGVSPIKTQAPA